MYKDHNYFAFSSGIGGQVAVIKRFLGELDAGAVIVSTTVVGESVHYIIGKINYSAAQGALNTAQAQTIEVPAHD